jgi:citrate lyase synthetase
MSVVIDPAFHGQGLATSIVTELVRRMRAVGKESIHLMCKERHLSLYERLGYIYVKESASDHGGMSWHEMLVACGPSLVSR